MTQERRLAAIMFTDIVGYTRLMGQSEEKALSVLQANRTVQKPLIARHHGRFIKELGDGTMASFDKASDAVRCAIEIQKAAKEFPDLNLRMGIHLGEVVFENDDVFGDGVNIAARIESAGKAGAIYISGAVHGTVHNRDDIETRFVERMQLKNVSRPIEIHEVAVDGVFSEVVPKAAVPRTSFSKRKGLLLGAAATLLLLAGAYAIWGRKATGGAAQLEHASIAVLPFTNMSSDAENEFFCDGVTEDILTHLSKLKHLKVISRTSVMHFKGSTLSIPEIAEQLGVDYVVEGSVRKAGDRVAITAQLIQASTDGHLWAENYERPLDDVFAIQREVARDIARALDLKISVQERQGLDRSSTEDLRAYQLYLQGREAASDRSVEGIERSISLLKKAIELDPKFVDARAELAYSLGILATYDHRPKLRTEAKEVLDEALAMDPGNANVYVGFANIYKDWDSTYTREWDRVTAKALDLDPNNAFAHFHRGLYLETAGDIQGAYIHLRQALELDPFSPVIKTRYLQLLVPSGRLSEALRFQRNNPDLVDDFWVGPLVNAALDSGRWEEALALLKGRVMDGMWDNGDVNRYAEHLFYLTGDAGAVFAFLDSLVVTKGVSPMPETYVMTGLLAGKADRVREWVEREVMSADTARNQYILYVMATMEGNHRSALEHALQLPDNGFLEIGSRARLGQREVVLERLATDRGLGAYNQACFFALTGEVDSALTRFERVNNAMDVAFSRLDPDLDAIRNEPRYQAKLAEYRFPPLVERP